ncbi:helix-turn-helix domain-containing protein [Bordetella pseudohinzii]|uniref:Transcriptional repressor DicA n=1 Tax=Bordetella pseudohinzii TaxID=1331258 RepID=A0A0M9IG76_9BORD|nr:helix-turn-helix transcriptional regulator [Bordetella pseudohinzii]CUJ01484.1 transcriptional repressor DicA [Bordetella pseudohinzii]
METFGHRLRSARVLRGWTQKDLAAACQLSQSAIGNYESGLRTRPSGASLIKLTRALRVTAQWLSSGEGPMRGEGGPEDVAWPFDSVPYASYLALTQREKRQLEQVLAAYIAGRNA